MYITYIWLPRHCTRYNLAQTPHLITMDYEKSGNVWNQIGYLWIPIRFRASLIGVKTRLGTDCHGNYVSVKGNWTHQLLD